MDRHNTVKALIFSFYLPSSNHDRPHSRQSRFCSPSHHHESALLVQSLRLRSCCAIEKCRDEKRGIRRQLLLTTNEVVVVNPVDGVSTELAEQRNTDGAGGLTRP